MMKGNNRLVLNEATMMEIVQYWLDNKMLNKDERSPKVASFGVAEGTSRLAPAKFEVRLEEPAT